MVRDAVKFVMKIRRTDMTEQTEPVKKRRRPPAPWRAKTMRVPLDLHPQFAAMMREYKAAALAAARGNSRP